MLGGTVTGCSALLATSRFGDRGSHATDEELAHMSTRHSLIAPAHRSKSSICQTAFSRSEDKPEF